MLSSCMSCMLCTDSYASCDEGFMSSVRAPVN